MLCRRLDRPDIKNFFRLRVADTFRSQDEDPEDNKDNADDRNGSHILRLARSGPNLGAQWAIPDFGYNPLHGHDRSRSNG